MFDSLAYVIAGLAFALQLYIVAHALYRKEFFRYFTVNAYMMACALANAGQFLIFRYLGYETDAYRYYYYYSNGVCTVLLFFVILGLYQQVFEEMAASKYIRGGAVILLALTAVFSFMVVQQQRLLVVGGQETLANRFAFELSQNMNFVGVVLTYLLWFAVKQLKETRLRLLQLVLSLGVYFAGVAAVFAFARLSQKYPGLEWTAFRVWSAAFMGLFLPASWAVTFTRVSEEARLATARVANAHR